MQYTFEFGSVFEYTDVLLHGIWITIQLTFVGAAVGVLLGIFGAWVRTQGPRWLRPVISTYVELIRNTPFLIQLFFIFFGLPAIGIRLTELQGAALAMIVNLGAYSTEIIRAGIEVTPRGQTEAGLSLAMSRIQIFRHVILNPSLRRIWPALCSQIVIVMLGSAVVSQIAAEDLTYAANFIQSRNFRAFEVYIVVTLIYLVLVILLRQILTGLGWFLFSRVRR